ncbi:hypothetical protein FRB90_006746 [Tulasnella sp. 427]|nr:hypothetical protein FRB90_006746 [Tulasnella sp. 427]
MAIQYHVSTIVNRYKGKVNSWDVCAEVLNEDGTKRTSVFLNVLGTNFINIAFAAARAADPIAKLYIVDHNIDSVNAKSQALLVKQLFAAGIPIDGIGLEGKLGAGGASGLLAELTLLGTAAPELAITQLSITSSAATDYVAVMKACITSKKCVGITSAGVADTTSSSGLLFDSQYNPKPAYNALLKV